MSGCPFHAAVGPAEDADHERPDHVPLVLRAAPVVRPRPRVLPSGRAEPGAAHACAGSPEAGRGRQGRATRHAALVSSEAGRPLGGGGPAPRPAPDRSARALGVIIIGAAHASTPAAP